MNFTLADTLGVLKACLALAPFLFAPGYVAGWALDLFEFRRRRPLVRVILAVPLTIAVGSMFSYLLARFLPPGLWVFYFGVSAVCLVLLARELPKTIFVLQIHLDWSRPDDAVDCDRHRIAR